jgi:hypothetical protein
MFIWFITYVFLCSLVGAAGSNQPIGFLGYTLLSFFISPIVGLIVLLIFKLYAKASSHQAKQSVEN